MRLKRVCGVRRWCVAVWFLSVLFVGFFVGDAGAQSADELIDEYAPVLYFVGDEECYPVAVEYHIENALLYQLVDDTPMLLPQPPGDVNLSGLDMGSVFVLDNDQGTVGDRGVIEQYMAVKDDWGYTVYARVFESGSMVVVQYWLFYAFNDGDVNQHEGDWELVQVVVSDGVVSEVMVSQHYGGQRAQWSEVEHEGSHVKVFVARGSHANYFRSYSGVFGGGSDQVGADGVVLMPGEYSLVRLDDQEWLGFSGYWGEYGSAEDVLRGRGGPFGPMFRAEGVMWDDPLGWGAGLSPVSGSMFLLEWFLYYFVWIVIGLTALSLGVLGFRLYRRYKRTGLGPRYVSMLYIDRFDMKSMGNVLAVVAVAVAFVGLLLPWYCVFADIQTSAVSTEGYVNLIHVDGLSGVSVNLLDGSRGPVELGAFVLPFSLVIAVGLVLFIVGTVGMASSCRLGRKYVVRGVLLLVPVIILVIGVMMLGGVDLGVAGDMEDVIGADTIVQQMAGSPFGGSQTVSVGGEQVVLMWGVCYGGGLLVLAGVLLIVAGACEIKANTVFFKQKELPVSRKPLKSTEKE